QQRANQLAHALQRQHVGPDVRVGIACEPGVDLAVALWGVLKAGGAYVPFDPLQPRARLESLLRNTGTALLLTHRRLASALAGVARHVIAVDDESVFAGEPVTGPAVHATGDQLAYCMHTSGSTGEPRAVTITHRNLYESTLARGSDYAEPVERFLLLSP